ncbi:MAG TPA: VOC family protein [Solirubrobacterales bacterium]
MAIERMDHVGVVVDDLAAAIEFFVELGLELRGEESVEGSWVDRVVGLDDVGAEIAMLQTPDGHGRRAGEIPHAVDPGWQRVRAGEHTGHPPCRIRRRRHRRRSCRPASSRC